MVLGASIVVFLAVLLPLVLVLTPSASAVPTADRRDGGLAFSPPVYPAPMGTGSGDWAQAYAKAKAFVGQLTLLEKVNLTTGTGWQSQQCVGNLGSVPRLGFRSLCLQDSPTGVRFTDYNTAFLAGVTIASTWDKDALYARGHAMGEEFKGKGVNIGLLPVCGPLGKNPLGGRNWEGFSPDPVLAGWAMRQSIMGLQDAGIIATAKHYIGNEQEHFRQPGDTPGFPDLPSESSNVDDRTLHELYMWPFADAVRAGVGSIMCSYNQVNNSYACQNSKLLNGLLKDELGFQGFVMSDWSAQHAGVASALAGLDVTMPGDVAFNDGLSFWGPNLTTAVLNGTIPISRLDDMVTRIIAAWYRVGQDKGYPDAKFSSWTLDTNGFANFGAQVNFGVVNEHIDVRGNHGDLMEGITADSIILLKNVKNALPLKKPKQIGVFGGDAGDSPKGPNGFPDRGGINGTLAMGWGSGTANFPYLISPLEAIQERARQDGSMVQWVLEDFNYDLIESTAQQASVCLAFLNSDSGEGYITVDFNQGDRRNFSAWHGGDQLVASVAGNCANTIVVVHAVGTLDIESFADHPNVTAILWAHLPGQESGNSLVQVLYGDVNPSGRLPYTIAKSPSDYSSDVVLVPSNGNTTAPQIDYTEGLLVDYRAFDARNIKPRYEFGFGLSYTTFDYSQLTVKDHGSPPYASRPPPSTITPPSAIPSDGDFSFPSTISRVSEFIYPYINGTPTATTTPSPISTPFPFSPAGGGSGGNPSLYDVLYTVTVKVENSGSVAGKDVPQLYVSYPASAGEPPQQLRGFEKVSLRPGESTTVKFDVTRRDLSMWDVVQQNWKMVKGDYTFGVGHSSRQIVLKNKIQVSP